MYEEFTWTNAKHDPMIIEIRHHGRVIMHFFLGEAMEGAGRKRVMAHVRECDHSPWMTEWHQQAQDELLDTLKQ